MLLLVILSFVKTSVDKQAVFLCEKVKETNADMASCPVHKSNVSWMLVFAFGIGFLLFGIGIYFLMMHKPLAEQKADFESIDVSKLDDEEKKIYELLKAKEGSMYQTDLIKETGFSKVKMTRLLDKIETKRIIERKRRGMTNIIVLK